MPSECVLRVMKYYLLDVRACSFIIYQNFIFLKQSQRFSLFKQTYFFTRILCMQNKKFTSFFFILRSAFIIIFYIENIVTLCNCSSFKRFNGRLGITLFDIANRTGDYSTFIYFFKVWRVGEIICFHIRSHTCICAMSKFLCTIFLCNIFHQLLSILYIFNLYHVVLWFFF